MNEIPIMIEAVSNGSTACVTSRETYTDTILQIHTDVPLNEVQIAINLCKKDINGKSYKNVTILERR